MADHDVAEENNADRDQSVEAEEERRVIFIIIIVETIHEVMWASYGHFLKGNSIVFKYQFNHWCHHQ